MANNDVMIKDAPLVGSLNGNEKIPISDGSNRPRAVSIEMIKSFVGNKEVDLSGYATKEELEDKQDKISDLATIREGAEKGGVAYEGLPNKVDKVEGKALSTNDYTNEDKEKLDSLNNYDDTEIRNKIEEIINESPIFEAIYGETTYDEIVNAKNEGKWVTCNRGEITYHLALLSNTSAWFSTVDGEKIERLWCLASSGAWFSATYRLEETRNRTTSLSSESTDAQYPSAKAVYDFVQDTLGTIINGDY